jgi:hypothetical protein
VTHRLFWLTVGAGLGISGYRRVNRAIRSVTRQAPHRPRPQLAGVAEFARDVKDGMDLYQEQQRLNIQQRRAARAHTLDVHRGSDAESGRDSSRAHG